MKDRCTSPALFQPQVPEATPFSYADMFTVLRGGAAKRQATPALGCLNLKPDMI